MKENPICYCFEVYEKEIVEIIRKHNVVSLKQFQQHCNASMGCGSCGFDIEDIIETETKDSSIQTIIQQAKS